jgi:copper chaperone
MLTLHIPAISCGHCVRAITAAVQELDPAATVEADIGSKQVRIDSSAAQAPLLARLEEEGYPASITH